MLSPTRRLWYHKQAGCSAHISTRWHRRCETGITQPTPSAPICGKPAPSAQGSPPNSMTTVRCCLRAISTRAQGDALLAKNIANNSLPVFLMNHVEFRGRIPLLRLEIESFGSIHFSDRFNSQRKREEQEKFERECSVQREALKQS